MESSNMWGHFGTVRAVWRQKAIGKIDRHTRTQVGEDKG